MKLVVSIMLGNVDRQKTLPYELTQEAFYIPRPGETVTTLVDASEFPWFNDEDGKGKRIDATVDELVYDLDENYVWCGTTNVALADTDMTPEDIAAAQAAGWPVRVIDSVGEPSAVA